MNLREFYGYFFLFRTFLVKDSDRKPPNSLQKLTECLCDATNMPLLHDPALDKVGFCYEALPHYKTFVNKREAEVLRGVQERKESAAYAARAELEAELFEVEATIALEREAIEIFQCSMAGMDWRKEKD